MQEHEIIRIGGEAPIPVDVRFIVATNRNLRKMVEEGTFRNDLYFRVNILNLLIPFAIEQVIFLCRTNTILKSTVRLFLNKFHHIFYPHFLPHLHTLTRAMSENLSVLWSDFVRYLNRNTQRMKII